MGSWGRPRNAKDPVTGELVPNKADRIIQMYEDGMTPKQIWTTYDVSKGYVLSVLRKWRKLNG